MEYCFRKAVQPWLEHTARIEHWFRAERPYCKVCLGKHIKEIHGATRRVRAWFWGALKKRMQPPKKNEPKRRAPLYVSGAVLGSKQTNYRVIRRPSPPSAPPQQGGQPRGARPSRRRGLSGAASKGKA